MRYFEIEYIYQGKIKSVVIAANKYSEAVEKFKKSKKGVIKEIREVPKPEICKDILKKLDISKVNLEEFIGVLDQLYVMLDAGIAIDVALSNVISEIKNHKLKSILESVQKDIQGGYSLTNAFAKFESELGKLTIAMIRLGEETGDIALAIRDLSVILSEILDNRKRLKKASRYPIFIIFAMSVAFVVVVLFVIPPFKSMFENLQTELPLPTQFLLWLENALATYGLFILGGAIGIFAVISYFYATNYKVRLFLDKLMLRVFIIGEVIKLAMLGRFTYVFQRLVDSGIPILDAVDIALNIIENEYIKKNLSVIKTTISTGGSIKSGFQDAKMFEPMIVQMVAAGEESGALVAMLQKVSKYYIEKYRYMVDNISTLIEPILIAAIAGFVVTLALGIFLPMWNLTQMVH